MKHRYQPSAGQIAVSGLSEALAARRQWEGVEEGGGPRSLVSPEKVSLQTPFSFQTMASRIFFPEKTPLYSVGAGRTGSRTAQEMVGER